MVLYPEEPVCVVKSSHNYHNTISITQITALFASVIIQTFRIIRPFSYLLEIEPTETNTHYVPINVLL